VEVQSIELPLFFKLRLIIALLGTPTEKIWPGMTKLPVFQNYKLMQQPYNNIKAVFADRTPECIELLNSLFVYDPKWASRFWIRSFPIFAIIFRRRSTAKQCLDSEYFKLSPLPCDPSIMPSLSGLTRKRKRKKSSSSS
jgi:hypothetical protein